MAPEALTKEQLTKVRRVMLQRPLPSPEALAQSAARTPTITRFIIAKQKKLEKLRSEAAGASPLTTASSPDAAVKNCNQQKLPSRLEVKKYLKGDEIKTYFATSRQLNNNNGIGEGHPSNPDLPHTPGTFRLENERRLKVKGRRDIYDLSEDDTGFTTAPAREAALDHKTSAVNTSYAEPRTSSFRYPDSPSSPGSQESQTIEECLKLARQALRLVSGLPSKIPSPNCALVTSGTTVPEKPTGEAQELPFSPQQGDNLTELDREILQLGEDNHTLPSTAAQSLPSHGRARNPVKRHDIYDLVQYADDADGESDADFEQLLPKKRRCSSRRVPGVEARNAALEELNGRRMLRTARISTGDDARPDKPHRKPQKDGGKQRRLPVEELVIVSEQPGHSDVEVIDSRPAELSQDPISQRSDEQDSNRSEIEHRKTGLRPKINIRPRRRTEVVDISLFNIPKPQIHPPNSRRRRQLTPSYSDGFEGKEAEPIGIYMPVKHPARRRESYQKITIRLGELTIVPERPSEEIQIEPRRRPRRNQGRRKANETPPNHSDLENVTADTDVREISAQSPELELHLLAGVHIPQGEDNMVVDGQQEEGEADVQIPKERHLPLIHVLREQTTPEIVTSDGQITETPAYLTSPLKRKQSVMRDDGLPIDGLQEARSHPSRRPAENFIHVEGVPISQQLSMISAMKKTSTLTRAQSLEAEQELIMVSVRKRTREISYGRESSDSENASERESAESYADSESNDEDSSEEGDPKLIPEEESELDEKREEQASLGSMGDGAIENIGPDNYLVASVRAVSEVQRKNDATPDDPDLSTAAETEKRIPRSDHEAQSTHGRNGLDTGRDLQHIASQALQLDIPAQSKIPSQVNSSVPVNIKQGAEDNDTAVSSRSAQENQTLPVLVHSEQPDSCWRPRIPDTSGLAIEPEEEIIDSPSPAPLQNRQDVHRQASRRQSALGRQQLTMAPSRRSSPIAEKEPTSFREAEESVTPGDSGRIIRRSPAKPLPEAQFSNKARDPRDTAFFVPQISYMERAMGQLSQPTRRPNLTRTKSTSAHVDLAQQEQLGNTMMAGGIMLTGAFQHTISPVKSASRMPTLLEESPSEEKSLRTLTRQASLSLGTMSGSAKKRTVSLQFNPPFKK